MPPDSFQDPALLGEAQGGPNRREMRPQDRGRAMVLLLALAKNGKLPHGAISDVAKKFGVHRTSISKLWARAKLTRVSGVINSPEMRSKACRRGRKRIYLSPIVREAVKSIPLLRRTTQRKLSAELDVGKGTVQRWKERGILKSHTNSLRPYLTETNKLSRYLMATSFISKTKPGEYQDMMDLIHLDEKWFHVSRDGQRFLLTDDEPKPYRSCKHKSHITKVMFLCAVARPRFVPSMNAWWDGKLGIWPVGKWVPAQRSSVNRPKGTRVWKNQTITRKVYRDLLMEELMEAILCKWPEGDRNRRKIRLQQDGAKSHIEENDPHFVEFLKAMKEKGINAEFYTQAANSPDTNICDLGFFRAIQSYSLIVGSDEKLLIEGVQKAYEEYPREKLNHTWLTLQSCFNCIIEQEGGNDYAIPHMSKEALERRGELPLVLEVTDAYSHPSNNNLHIDS